MVEVEYEVEAIIGKRRRKGQIEYLVKWESYHEDEATWEPMHHLNCEHRIQQYEQSIACFVKLYISNEAIESRRTS